MGPTLFFRPAVSTADEADVPNYAVVQDDRQDAASTRSSEKDDPDFAQSQEAEVPQQSYQEIMAESEERMLAKMRASRGPLGWALRLLHNNPMGAGQIYEWHNVKCIAKRLPAQIVVGALYGLHYDIHASQVRLRLSGVFHNCR